MYYLSILIKICGITFFYLFLCYWLLASFLLWQMVILIKTNMKIFFTIQVPGHFCKWHRCYLFPFWVALQFQKLQFLNYSFQHFITKYFYMLTVSHTLMNLIQPASVCGSLFPFIHVSLFYPFVFSMYGKLAINTCIFVSRYIFIIRYIPNMLEY